MTIDKKILTIFILSATTTILLSLIISDFIVGIRLESIKNDYNNYVKKIDNMINISEKYKIEKDFEDNELLKKIDSLKVEKVSLLNDVVNTTNLNNADLIDKYIEYYSKNQNEILKFVNFKNDDNEELFKEYLKKIKENEKKYYEEINELFLKTNNTNITAITIQPNMPYILTFSGVS